MDIRKNKLFKILFKNYLTKAFSSFSMTQGITAVTNFCLVAVYTKILPPEDFGKLSMIWIFIVMLSMLVDGRLNTAFSIRYYKLNKEENTKNIYSIFIYNMAVLMAFCFLLLLFPALALKLSGVCIARNELGIVILLILCMLLGNFYTNILIISQRPKSYLFVNIIFNCVLILFTVLFLVILKGGYLSYLKAYLAAYSVISIMGLRYFLFYFPPDIKKVFSFNNLRELLKIGIPLVPAGLSLMLLTWANRYILNLYVGLAVVGIFSVGYKFTEIIDRFITMPFGQAVAPMMFKQYATNQDEYKKNLGRIMKYYWIMILGVIILYFVVLREAFELFIGSKYINGYYIIPIVLLGIVFMGAGGLLSGIIIVKEKTGKIFLFTLAVVLFNIILNFILIPRFEMYGAATATLLSYILQFLAIFTYAQKLLYVRYDYAFMVKSFIVSFCFLGVVFAVSCIRFSVIYALLIKMTIFVLFLYVSYKYLELKIGIKRILDYVKA